VSKQFNTAKVLPFMITKQRFIRPVSLNWARRAAILPGQALHVGCVAWYLAGLKLTDTVSLSAVELRKWGVSKWSTRRALLALESANLISVERQAGCLPWVTILDDETQP
jgi:hypothetical protein